MTFKKKVYADSTVNQFFKNRFINFLPSNLEYGGKWKNFFDVILI